MSESNMEKIKEALEPIVVEELARANEEFPQFHSSHEGVAVIEEEVEEAKESMAEVNRAFSLMKSAVFNDHFVTSDDLARMIRKFAKHAAAELIQVAAMCDKYMNMKECD